MTVKYNVLQFLDLPYLHIERYVVVPKSWIKIGLTEGRVLATYPKEDPEKTRERVQKGEPCEMQWRLYKAISKYETDHYDDAENWIASESSDEPVEFKYPDIDDNDSCNDTSRSYATETYNTPNKIVGDRGNQSATEKKATDNFDHNISPSCNDNTTRMKGVLLDYNVNPVAKNRNLKRPLTSNSIKETYKIFPGDENATESANAIKQKYQKRLLSLKNNYEKRPKLNDATKSVNESQNYASSSFENKEKELLSTHQHNANKEKCKHEIKAVQLHDAKDNDNQNHITTEISTNQSCQSSKKQQPVSPVPERFKDFSQREIHLLKTIVNRNVDKTTERNHIQSDYHPKTNNQKYAPVYTITLLQDSEANRIIIEQCNEIKDKKIENNEANSAFTVESSSNSTSKFYKTVNEKRFSNVTKCDVDNRKNTVHFAHSENQPYYSTTPVNGSQTLGNLGYNMNEVEKAQRLSFRRSIDAYCVDQRSHLQGITKNKSLDSIKSSNISNQSSLYDERQLMPTKSYLLQDVHTGLLFLSSLAEPNTRQRSYNQNILNNNISSIQNISPANFGEFSGDLHEIHGPVYKNYPTYIQETQHEGSIRSNCINQSSRASVIMRDVKTTAQNLPSSNQSSRFSRGLHETYASVYENYPNQDPYIQEILHRTPITTNPIYQPPCSPNLRYIPSAIQNYPSSTVNPTCKCSCKCSQEKQYFPVNQEYTSHASRVLKTLVRRPAERPKVRYESNTEKTFRNQNYSSPANGSFNFPLNQQLSSMYHSLYKQKIPIEKYIDQNNSRPNIHFGNNEEAHPENSRNTARESFEYPVGEWFSPFYVDRCGREIPTKDIPPKGLNEEKYIEYINRLDVNLMKQKLFKIDSKSKIYGSVQI